MSDPVTHAEIEDVLSSIRRLVSDDSRSGPAVPEPAARLVLTPALRVQEGGPDCPPAAEVPAVDDPAANDPAVETGSAPRRPSAGAADRAGQAGNGAEAPEPIGRTGSAALLEAEAPIAFRHRSSVPETGSSLDDGLADAEPDTGLQAVQPDPGDLDTGHFDAGHFDTGHFDTDHFDTDHFDTDHLELNRLETGRSDAGHPDTGIPDSGLNADVQDPQPQTAPGAAADVPWGDPNATLFAAAADADQPADGTAGPAAETPAGRQAPDSGHAIETAGARAASVVRKIAELEARSARGKNQDQQQWEPDSQTEAPFAGTVPDTIEWRDEPLSARRAGPQAGGGASAADDAPQDAGAEVLPGPGVNDGSTVARAETVAEAAVAEAAAAGAALETLTESADGYLDEDSLRELVASIVREELQGPLGERITRNVRKLVRREIQRALAAHDLL
ncbi:hypothetical protein [Leisingera sp.]|uniref:hypothetical protein n=1 Tax=Leisingera sp. TaxID=1879318 RepID=UPI002B279086|nr:hypothetical protein [Leisingera sp.]